MIEVKVIDEAVLDALARLDQAVTNPRPPMLKIGECLVSSTKLRFNFSTAPDGTKWAANSPSYLKSLGILGVGKKPLIGETGDLSRQIHWQYVDGTLLVGSSVEKYAAMQQFGGETSRFPNLWGDIPARPFLGVSSDDKTKIISIVNDFLRGAIVS